MRVLVGREGVLRRRSVCMCRQKDGVTNQTIPSLWMLACVIDGGVYVYSRSLLAQQQVVRVEHVGTSVGWSKLMMMRMYEEMENRGMGGREGVA